MTTILESELMPIRSDALPSVTQQAPARRSGRRRAPTGRTSAVFSKHCHGSRAAAVRSRRRRRRAARAIRIDPAAQSHLPLLARVRPRREGRPALRLSRRGTVGSREWPALRSRPRSSSTPMAGAWPCPRATIARAAGAPGDNSATAMKSVVVDPSRLRLGRRRAAAAAVRADHRVRDARARLHPPSQLRRRRADPRHLRRPDREDPLSAGARHHRGGAAAGVPVRCPGLSAGQGQLLGLCAGLVLRAAPGVQLAPGSARPGGRVPRHGQGAAPGRHRGDPRRRLQPHRGGR